MINEIRIDQPGSDPETTLLFVHEVQGSGAATPLAGQQVAVEAVVTSTFERNDVLDGFFIQEEDGDADGDPATSEGVFVFCGADCPAALSEGDLVQVTGEAAEVSGMTQLTATATAGGTTTLVASGTPLPAPVALDLPAAGSTQAADTFEHVEGMVVTFPDTLVVSEHFQLARFGQLVLTVDDRPYQFTHSDLPNVGGYAAFLADLASRRIILDDDNNDQNDAIFGASADEPYPYPEPGLSISNRFRGGDTVTGLTGVLHWSFAGSSGTDAWRIRPVDSVNYTFQSANPSPAAPPGVGGSVRVAGFNVLNYFTTIDETSSSSSGACGPSRTLDCRGADSEAERGRQLAKIVTSIQAMDADVVGLVELENDGDDASIASIVEALNAGGGPVWSYVPTGFIGADAIKVGLIHTDAVTLVGTPAVLDTPAFVDPNATGEDRNRPALAASFAEVASGEVLTVVVNHLKSKGSSGLACSDPSSDPDCDQGDGQAFWNDTRTEAALTLADWLAGDPTGSGDPDVLIVGDLNAYRNEDPIRALEDAGYVDLAEAFIGDAAYSFLFDGQLGYLDHALANASLAAQVAGTGVWHTNADEVPLFDYNDEVRDVPGESSFERESAALPLYEPDAFRASDHDPVLVGLELVSEVPSISIDDVSVTEDTAGSGRTSATFTVTLSEPAGGEVTVDFATADGTATSPDDYQARSGTLTVPAGTTTRVLRVGVVPDAADEPNETFFVNLSNPTGATIADGQGMGTIVDDDPPPAVPTVSVGDATVTEGPGGTTTVARFTVTLSQASTETVTVEWSTAEGTATGSPTPGADYKSQPPTTITFTPGQTSRVVSVTVRGDDVPEPDETFFVNLSNPVNATIGDGQGVGTILNDD